MYKFLKDLLKEKNENNSLAIDEILGKIQKRALSVIGLLSKVWLKLKNAKKLDAPTLFLSVRRDFKSSRTNHLFTWLNR